MTAQVVPATTGGGGSGTATADNRHGSVLVTPGATGTLVSITAGTTKLRGFKVHGDTDAEAWIEVDGVELPGLRSRHSRALEAYVVLPNPEPYASPTSTVQLRVRNDGGTSVTFEGVLLGE